MSSWIQYVQFGTLGVGPVNSGWMIFLADQGYSQGSLNERMFQWLRAEGYTGSLSDMIRVWKQDNMVL